MNQHPKWKALSAKFSEREMIPIKAVQKLHGLNNSQLVRISMLYGTHTLLLLKILNNSSMAMTKVMEPVAKTIFNDEVQKIIESELVRVKSEIEPQILKEAEEQFALLNECIKAFWEHNKPGRPADPTQKRGRPKNEGNKSSNIASDGQFS